jgi:hypothetical protein
MDELELVAIHWDDAMGPTGPWEGSDSISPLIPAKCKTVGFVLEENDLYITVVQTYYIEENGTPTVSGRMTIPKGCIEAIKRNIPIKARKIKKR